jgi:hypothetical protein
MPARSQSGGRSWRVWASTRTWSSTRRCAHRVRDRWQHHHPLDRRAFGSDARRDGQSTERRRARMSLAHRSLVSGVLRLCHTARADQGSRAWSWSGMCWSLAWPRVGCGPGERKPSKPFRIRFRNRRRARQGTGFFHALKAASCVLFTCFLSRAPWSCACHPFTNFSSLSWDRPLNNALFLPVETAEPSGDDAIRRADQPKGRDEQPEETGPYDANAPPLLARTA